MNKVYELPDWWTLDLNKIESIVSKIIVQFPKTEQSRLTKARNLAFKLHQNQFRKNRFYSNLPYIIHPFRVFISLYKEFGEKNVDLLIAGFLHDTFEDSNLKREQIPASLQTDQIISLLKVLTRKKKRKKEGDSKEDAYYQGILEFGQKAIILKLADKLDNLRDAYFHPNIEKKEIFLAEGEKIFLPMIEKLEDEGKINISQRLFKIVLSNKDKKMSFEKFLTVSLQYCEPMDARVLKRAFPDFEKQLYAFLLLNPKLDAWLLYDKVQLWKPIKKNSTGNLIKNICCLFLDLIRKDPINRIFPEEIYHKLSDDRRFKALEDFQKELLTLIELIETQSHENWIKYLLQDPFYIILIIHSRIVEPNASRLSLWEDDYSMNGKSVSKLLYSHLELKSSEAKFLDAVSVMLRKNKRAIFRFHNYIGSEERYINTIDSISEVYTSFNSKVSYSHLFAMRLLKEYLDLISANEETQDTFNQFSKIWNQSNFQNTIPRLFPGKILSIKHLYLKKMEIIGIEQIWNRSKTKKYERSIQLLFEIILKGVRRAKTSYKIKWIFFDVLEFSKREKEFIQYCLPKINPSTKFRDLKSLGIEVYRFIYDENVVFKIVPGKKLAFINRIPEITENELLEIDKKDFSAIAIFDTLILKKMGSAGEHLWIPRIFRFLDTIADFNPHSVQPIVIFFHANKKIKPLTTYLPLPDGKASEKNQQKRKKIIARYIVTTIYNYAVSIGIFGASIEVAPLRRAFVFRQAELDHLVKSAAIDFGFSKAYDKFLENFNFNRFNILSPLFNENENDFYFNAQIIQEGKFWGIDIGGTNIKACLINGHQVTRSLTENGDRKFEVFNFPTIPPGKKRMEVSAFCGRVIRQIKKYSGEKFKWSEIDGVGISWAGGVRKNPNRGFFPIARKIDSSFKYWIGL